MDAVFSNFYTMLKLLGGDICNPRLQFSVCKRIGHIRWGEMCFDIHTIHFKSVYMMIYCV